MDFTSFVIRMKTFEPKYTNSDDNPIGGMRERVKRM